MLSVQFSVSVLAFCAVATLASQSLYPFTAIAHIQGSDGKVGGYVRFKEFAKFVLIRVHISGLSFGKHGLHVHQFGDLSNGCANTGKHFNPFGVDYGAPDDAIRHVGDLGNVVADEYGTVDTKLIDYTISLTGERSIIGRSLVIHEEADDMGKTQHPESKATGNSGARAGCGIIGIDSTDYSYFTCPYVMD